jgi:hypothetical protein
MKKKQLKPKLDDQVVRQIWPQLNPSFGLGIVRDLRGTLLTDIDIQIQDDIRRTLSLR